MIGSIDWTVSAPTAVVLVVAGATVLAVAAVRWARRRLDDARQGFYEQLGAERRPSTNFLAVVRPDPFADDEVVERLVPDDDLAGRAS